MILHHVPDNPNFIEVAATPFRTKGLFKRDLHVRNMVAMPSCAEKGIRKAQNEEIFDHLFA